MTYSLTPLSRDYLARILADADGSHTVLHLERAAQNIAAALVFEQAEDKLTVTITLGHHRSEVRLQSGDPANAQHLREQIEAIANGTADTAETGAIGTPSPPAREPFALCEDDEASLRHLVRIGGTRHLECGASITVHNALNAPRRDALVTTPVGTQHLHAGTPGELYVVAAQHIETALNAA